jgi:hypothetical protein
MATRSVSEADKARPRSRFGLHDWDRDLRSFSRVEYKLECTTAFKDTEPNCSGLEKNSLGNGNRDDRIRTCDFLVPNQAL